MKTRAAKCLGKQNRKKKKKKKNYFVITQQYSEAEKRRHISLRRAQLPGMTTD